MSTENTFQVAWGQGISVAPTNTSARSEIGSGNSVLCITNTGTETLYVRCGDSGVVATAADYILLVGAQVTISKFKNMTHLAYLSATATDGALHAIPGEGF